MKSTFSIIYYLKRQVVKQDGTVPVMGRITIDGTQAQFSCKMTVDPKLWDTKTGRMMGKSAVALETNRNRLVAFEASPKASEERMLDKMRVTINKHYQEIMDRESFATAE